MIVISLVISIVLAMVIVIFIFVLILIVMAALLFSRGNHHRTLWIDGTARHACPEYGERKNEK